ncbi:hypothetical protein EON80_08270 [bacterium]|nr:MAG: hypothetical protein EON80_08270 [bacterium]
MINSGQHKKIKALSGQTLLVVNLAVAAIIALLSGYDSNLWLRIAVGAIWTSSFLLLMALFDFLSKKKTSRLGRAFDLMLFMFAAMVWFLSLAIAGSIYFSGHQA